MLRDDAIEELTPLHMAAHDALGVHLVEQGYIGAPHWLCCSSEAKAKGLGLLYGRFAADGLSKDDVDKLVNERYSNDPTLLAWIKRELNTGDARGWSD